MEIEWCDLCAKELTKEQGYIINRTALCFTREPWTYDEKYEEDMKFLEENDFLVTHETDECTWAWLICLHMTPDPGTHYICCDFTHHLLIS